MNKTNIFSAIIGAVLFLLLAFTYFKGITVENQLKKQLEEKNRVILDIQSTVRQYEDEIIELHDKIDKHKKLWNCNKDY